MTRPGDLVYCTTQPGDPRHRHGMTGLNPPRRGCVYTVSAVLPGPTGEDTYIFEEAGSRYVDSDGDTVLVTWRAECFRPVERRANVTALLDRIMHTMTRQQLKEYQDDFAEMKREADRHRQAKY